MSNGRPQTGTIEDNPYLSVFPVISSDLHTKIFAAVGRGNLTVGSAKVAYETRCRKDLPCRHADGLF